MSINKCLPPTACFTVDGQEGKSICLSEEEVALFSDNNYMSKKSYEECVKRQYNILLILKQRNIDGKLMRFRKWWRCSIGWHSWYSFSGYYSVCDNCGIIEK